MAVDNIKRKASNFIDDITEELKIAYLARMPELMRETVKVSASRYA